MKKTDLLGEDIFLYSPLFPKNCVSGVVVGFGFNDSFLVELYRPITNKTGAQLKVLQVHVQATGGLESLFQYVVADESLVDCEPLAIDGMGNLVPARFV